MERSSEITLEKTFFSFDDVQRWRHSGTLDIVLYIHV